MDKNKCTIIGTLSKVHGYKGDLILTLEPDFSIDITGTEMVFLEIKGLLVPFFISSGNIQSRDTKSVFIKFDDVDDEDNARNLIGSKVYSEGTSSGNPNPVPNFNDYLSYIVTDLNAGKLGIIEKVISISSNPIIQIRNDKTEILIPAHKSFFISVDHMRKTIVIQAPDGLLDIYL